MDQHLNRLQAELEALISGATDEAMQKAPPGKWNSAQILEHLCLTYKATNKGIAKCLEAGAPLGTAPSASHRLASYVVIGLGYVPRGRKAPERAIPRGMLPAEVRGAVADEIHKMSAGLDECERRFGTKARILDHPFLGPLTASEWRKFHRVHGRHHLRQINERMKL